MNSGAAQHSAEVTDRKRLHLILAGAALFAAVGFGLILLLFIWLPYLAMTWADQHPQAVAALLPRNTGPVFWIFLILFSTTVPVLGALTGLLVGRQLRSHPKPEIYRKKNRQTWPFHARKT
jgi:hypothetical protein